MRQKNSNKNVSACNQVMRKPVCRGCIEDEIEFWLKQRNSKLLTGLHKKAQEFSAKTKISDGICSACNQRFEGCTHCYITYIQKWISEKDPDLTPSFKLFFNF